jgi:hypothetical protein
VAEAPPPPPSVDLPKLVADGTTFIEELDEKDTKGRYFISVDSLKKGLTWTWKTGEDASATRGTVKTAESSLQGARDIALIVNGKVMPKNKKEKSTPPFLLSRSIEKVLKEGKAAKVELPGLKAQELKSDGTEVRNVNVDGTVSTVSTMRATNGHVTIWYADDPQWPVLVSLTSDDGDSIELTEVHTRPKGTE